MLETLLNYGIFFAVIILIAIITAVVRRSNILTGLFKVFGKTLLVLLQIGMLLVFTFLISMAAGLIIFIHPYLYGTSHFFANGEGVHFLSTQDQALLQFASTYGVLYMIILFLSMRFFAKTRLTKFFIGIARTIRRLVPYRRSHKNLENKLIGTALQLMTSGIMLLVYPVAIALLFPHLDVTAIGNLSLFVCLFLFSMAPMPGYANSRENRKSYQVRTLRKRA